VSIDRTRRSADERLFRAFLDPTGHTERAADGPARAPRPERLAGARVGLLWNTKQNAELLICELGRLLSERYGAVVTARQMPYAHAIPLDGPDLTSLVEQCDVALVGVGDCGSCAAAAVADGMSIERHGIPAAVICSDAFETTAQATAEVQGDSAYAFLTTPHPIAVLTPEQVTRRADRLLPEVVARLSAGDGS